MASELKKYTRFFETVSYVKKLHDFVVDNLSKDQYRIANEIAREMGIDADQESGIVAQEAFLAQINKLSEEEAERILKKGEFEESAPRRLKSVKDHSISAFAMRLKELIGKYGKKRIAEEISYEIEEMLHTILEKDNNLDDQYILEALRKMNRKVKNGIRDTTD